jgi:hypothetical protein
MPKRANAKKMAAQAYTKMKSLDAATTDGKYYVARVEKALGNCGFQATIELPNGRVHEVQVLVRGKMKGGRACATRVEVGCFVLADGDISKKVLEVVGVVNRQAELEKLKRSGRVSRSFVEAAERKHNGQDDEDLFDRDGAEEQEQGIWDKKDEERSAQADEILGRYIQREAAGVRYRAAAAERAGPEEAVAGDGGEWVDAEDDDDAPAAGGGGPAPRRRRVKKVVTFVPNPAEAADGLNLWAAGATACDEVEDAEMNAAWGAHAAKSLATRKVPDRWDADDDLDAMIDAI